MNSLNETICSEINPQMQCCSKNSPKCIEHVITISGNIELESVTNERRISICLHKKYYGLAGKEGSWGKTYIKPEFTIVQ